VIQLSAAVKTPRDIVCAASERPCSRAPSLQRGLWVYFYELRHAGTAALWIAIGLDVALTPAADVLFSNPTPRRS